MKSYANEADKRLIVSFAGCKGFAEKMLEVNPKSLEAVQSDLKEIVEHSEAVIEHLMHDLDQDQVRGVLRYCNDHQIVVISNASPNAKQDVYTVEKEPFDFLLSDVVADCEFCTKGEKERKKCERRKAMLTCGVEIKSNDKFCPYYCG